MNGHQRIVAALKDRKPDTVPIMLHNFMMAAREAGYSQAQYRNDPKKIADTFIKSIEKYHYDGIVVDIDTVTLAGALGVPIDFPDNVPARSHQGCLRKIEDVKNLKRISIGNYKYIQIWLEAVRILKSYFGNEIFIRGNCDQAPFALASIMRTPQEFMMDLYGQENLVLELLDYCCDVTCQFIRLMSETGADMVSNGDSPAGPEMISPDFYRHFALPYEKKVVEEAHSCGKPYTLHICGNTSSILNDMVQTGADAIELDYKTDIFKVHDLCKDDIVFIGNIDPSNVLARGSRKDVCEKTNELLQVFSDTNRFILNAGCAIPDSTPSENLESMIKTARSFEAKFI
jgi:uroporphyrinogen decarboxylase